MIRPVISKTGCNAGLCHAAQHGKADFKLSIFGFEPEKDYLAITRQHGQRRISPLRPEDSLLLLKATNEVSHGGGGRFAVGSIHYRIFRDWIAAGAPASNNDEPAIKALRVRPARRIADVGERQQLRVDAHYNDGSIRDVTAWAKFESNDKAVVSVTGEGLAGVAAVSLHDVPSAVQEARYVVGELGLQAVFVRPNRHGGRNLHDAAYEPLWAAVEALGVPLAVHEGTGGPAARDRCRSLPW